MPSLTLQAQVFYKPDITYTGCCKKGILCRKGLTQGLFWTTFVLQVLEILEK